MEFAIYIETDFPPYGTGTKQKTYFLTAWKIIFEQYIEWPILSEKTHFLKIIYYNIHLQLK